MTNQEVSATINSYHNKIINCQNQMQKFIKDIQKLEDVQRKLKIIQDDFLLQQDQRRQSLENFRHCTVNPRLVARCHSKIERIIYHNEFDDAFSGLSEANKKIKNKIGCIDQEIKSLKNEISYCHSQINHLNTLS